MGMAKSTSVARKPPGLQVLRNVGLSASTVQKPRIIHTYSPKVYKIKPEEFLDLVQKLTGRAGDVDTELSVAPSRHRHVDVDFSTATSTSQRDSSVDVDESHHEADSTVQLGLGTPVSTQLLSSLPSPRFVTLNFLPMLSTTPSAFTPSRRDAGLSLRSAAY